jgi:hypothetical protein
MSHEQEAAKLKRGVVRGTLPTHWCSTCRTYTVNRPDGTCAVRCGDKTVRLRSSTSTSS